MLDLGGPHLRLRHDPWSTLAYAAHSADVRDTVVEGRVLIRERVLTTLDGAAAPSDLEALA